MSDFGLEGRGDRVGEPSHNRYGLSPCTCPNCTEREAKVMAEANERRKALLALDQAMKDLASGRLVSSWPEHVAVLTGQIANATDAWVAARRFILPGERPE